jgi:DNA-binding IclR family transcriptional regulator
LDLVEENPYCTISQVSERLGIAFATAQRGVDRLVSLEILEQTDAARRNRVYCARKMMDILEEPPVF